MRARQIVLPARVLIRFLRLTLLLLASFALYGCGYGFSGQSADPTRLPPENTL